MSAIDSEPNAAASLPQEISLKHTPLWYPRLSLLLLCVGLFGFGAIEDAWTHFVKGAQFPLETIFSVSATLLCLLLFSLTLIKRYWARRKKPLPIVFAENAVRLPRSSELWRYRDIRYDEIIALHEGGHGVQRALLVETQHHLIQLPHALFVSQFGPELLVLQLRQHILALPQGSKLLEDTEKLRQKTRLTMLQKPWATQIMLGLMAVFFFNTWLKGALDTPFGLVRWGANAPILVAHGETYRLLAANFLHSHWVHALVNALALHFLGSLLERVLGWSRLCIVFLVSGAVAMLASCAWSNALLSVGASGAIFGVLGGFGVVSWRLRAALPLEYRQPSRWWIFMLVSNALVPMYLPGIDITAHLVGFVTGAFLTQLLLGRTRRILETASLPVLLCACACIGAYLGALGMAVAHAARSAPDSDTVFTQTLVQNPNTDVATLNSVAWLWALDPHSTPPQLRLAHEAIDKAIEKAPGLSSLYATLAMLETSGQKMDEATVAWQQALEHAEDLPEKQQEPLGASWEQLDRRLDASLYATNLSRALWARTESSPLFWNQGNKVWDNSAQLQLEQGVWTLHIDRALDHDLLVYALLLLEQEPVALVRIALFCGANTQIFRAPRQLTEQMGGASQARIELITLPSQNAAAFAKDKASTWDAWPLPQGVEPHHDG